MRFILSIVVFILIAVKGNSQKTEAFEIILPVEKIKGSLYNKINFLDLREDTSSLGIVSTGTFKEKTRVIAKRPIDQQISDVVLSLVDSTSENRTVLFQLRNFVFLEYPGLYRDRGFFFLKASLYFQKGEQYRRIRTIDTLVETSGSTYILFNEASRVINNFLYNNLLQPPRERETYTHTDILHIDSVEKSKLKAYSLPTLKDGMYRSFKSFINQEPDMDVIVNRKDKDILSVKIDAGNGKTFKVKPKEAYAIVDKGQAFIVVENTYCSMNRINGDFYFKGKAKVGASTSDIIGAAFLFAVLRNPLSDDVSKAMFEMKLDHSNGGFIRVKKAN